MKRRVSKPAPPLRCVLCGTVIDAARERERTTHSCGSGPTQRLRPKVDKPISLRRNLRAGQGSGRGVE